ncbi:glycosyltransferase family 2 protein [Aurantibacter sp.]|uniref:glycosyltransferase family 2 protein n=1 Tax=Aurantibacter sp. TaxID=2807103 RepID=UPI0035C78D0D
MKQVAIVIVTFNGIKWIEKCLKSIYESSVTPEIIIVDNNSNDDTTSYLKKNHKDITLIESETNLGFGAGNNLGISIALKRNIDFIFLLNQDAYLKKDTLSKLIEVHKNNKKYGILSPIHLNGNDLALDANFSRYIGQDRNPKLYIDAFTNKLKTVYSFPFINAAAWFIPSKVIKEVGGFDPAFFHYGEDDNYCHRILYHNYLVGVVPNCFVNHDREQNMHNLSSLSIKEAIKIKEREYKIQYCNILNNDYPNKYSVKVNYVKRQLIKNFLRLNLSKANYFYKEFKLLKAIKDKVELSRETNRIKGSHYIMQ